MQDISDGDDSLHEGFAQRLGLFNYDYVNKRILDSDGFGQPSGRIYAHLVAALRSGNKAQIQNAFRLAYREGSR